MIDTLVYKKIKYKDISSWLISIGALEEYVAPDGSSKKHPTESGRNIGIFDEIRRSMRGEYTVILYNADAQRFIVDNIAAIMDYNSNPQDPPNPEQPE